MVSFLFFQLGTVNSFQQDCHLARKLLLLCQDDVLAVQVLQRALFCSTATAPTAARFFARGKALLALAPKLDDAKVPRSQVCDVSIWY